jgi:DNA-directed RNA polymerase specialized sigma24 family protein
MKLQLNGAAVAHYAALCGPASNDTEADTRRVLSHFKANGHLLVTRRDVTAVLIASGFTNCVEGSTIRWEQGDAWYVLGNVLEAECSKEGRGYWRLPESEVLEAEPVTPAAPQVLQASPTMDWLRGQMEQQGLHRRVAAILKRKYPNEDYEDLVSHVAYHFTIWGADGYCDQKLAEGKPPSASALAHWADNKLVQAWYAEGKDALGREFRGARTQKEMDRRREGQENFVFPSSLRKDNDAPEAHPVFSDKGEHAGWDYQCPKDLPGQPSTLEERAQREAGDLTSLFEADQLDLARDIVRARRARNPDRYARFFDHLIQGRSREETAAIEGVSSLRVTHLYSRVREDLREAPKLLVVALKVLLALQEEPNSTTEEIKVETSLAPKELHTALGLLSLRGLAKEDPGQSWALTASGHRAADLKSLQPR